MKNITNITEKVEGLFDLKEHFEEKCSLFKNLIEENKLLKQQLKHQFSFLQIENENTTLKRNFSEISSQSKTTGNNKNEKIDNKNNSQKQPATNSNNFNKKATTNESNYKN